MKRHTFEILHHEIVGPRYRLLRVRSPQVSSEAKAGQYMHILPSTEGYDPLLRRAFSILRCQDDWFEMLYRVEGRGTLLLSQRRAGDFLDALGPLGQPFAMPQGKVLLVGGGIGVPPLVFLAESYQQDQQHNLTVSRETTVEAFIGVRTSDDMVAEKALRAATDALTIASQDGSVGESGLVTRPLERRLRELTANIENGNREICSVCACGPWPMLKAVAAICALYDVACQVSMEENMPCGIGICNGCVVPMLNAGDDYERFQRICVAGPVMDARQIDWGATTVTVGLEDGRAASESA